MTPRGADLDRLRTLDGVKWSKHGPDALPAWVADMDFSPAPAITAAIHSVLGRGDLGYHFAARDALPEAFADWQERHHGWRPDPDRIRVFCDVLGAIETVLHLHTAPGDGIVLFTPVYPPFRKAAEFGDRRIVDCPLDPEGWRLDADVLRSVIDDRTRVILLCNPHNPTGRVFTREELEAMVAVAEDHDLLILSDEIWSDLLHPGHTHVPTASLSEAAVARTITPTAASKSFSLAGLRCAVAHVGPDHVWQSIEALPPHLLGATSTFGAAATLAAWTDPDAEAWLDDTTAHLTAQRDHLGARLAAEAPAVGFRPAEGTYLAWLDLRDTRLAPDPAGMLLDEQRLVLSPGPDFGPSGAGWTRVNTATSRAILDEVIDRLVAALHPPSG